MAKVRKWIRSEVSPNNWTCLGGKQGNKYIGDVRGKFTDDGLPVFVATVSGFPIREFDSFEKAKKWMEQA